MDFPAQIRKLLSGQALEQSDVQGFIRELIGGRVQQVHAASWLTALAAKGENSHEIAAAALALREQMTLLTPVSGPVIDTCGTGGDSTGTFNISTAVAFVVAAAGVPVVKHGGRAVSSRSGSADVLRELGVNIERGPEWSQRCLDRFGYAFCYAPLFHAGMRHVAKIRQELGFRTLFNLIGPLANPARADYQLLGVGDATKFDALAGAVAELGTRRAVLVHSKDGLDEVSLSAITELRIVSGHEFVTDHWHPDQFGLGSVAISEIQADTPAASAAIIRGVLDNRDGPARRIVLANAAAALWTAEAVNDLTDGVSRAEEALRSGAARALLNDVAALSPQG